MEFLGLPFDVANQRQTLAMIDVWARQDEFSLVVTPNVDHMVRLSAMERDAPLWNTYREAEVIVCDSRVLQGLARLSGIELPLVTGSDLTAKLVADLARRRRSDTAKVAVIGGDAALLNELRTLYPTIEWTHDEPPMGVARNLAAQEEIAEFVERSEARIFLFAIGSPQSEIVCDLIKKRGKARGVGLCIGASLEFMTGEKKRAPRWMQALKLEWLFRLGSEPTRLWRRYLLDGPRIFRIWKKWHDNRRLAR